MATPAHGVVRLGRSLALGGLVLLLACAAHLNGGGSLPPAWALLLMWCLAALAAGTVTGRRLGPGAVTAVLGIGQLVVHLALTIVAAPVGLGGPGHAHGPGALVDSIASAATGAHASHSMAAHFGAAMLWSHVLATAGTALLVLYGEQALWALWTVLRPRLIPWAAAGPLQVVWSPVPLLAFPAVVPAPAYRLPRRRGPPTAR